MTKREFLARPDVAQRISFESDGEILYDAYAGSAMLAQKIWELYEKKGRALEVRPEVAGFMLMNGVDRAKAMANIGTVSV